MDKLSKITTIVLLFLGLVIAYFGLAKFVFFVFLAGLIIIWVALSIVLYNKSETEAEAFSLVGLLFILLVLLIPLPAYTIYLELYGRWQYAITGQPFTPEQTIDFLAKQMNTEVLIIEKYVPLFDDFNYYSACNKAGFVDNKTEVCLCDTVYLGILSNKKYVFVCVDESPYSLIKYVKNYKII